MFRNIRIAKESGGTLHEPLRIAMLTLDGQTIAGVTVNVVDFVAARTVDVYLH
jgi:hypothetical protein